MTYSSKEEKDAELANLITRCFALAMIRVHTDMHDPKGLWRKADWRGEKGFKFYARILANDLYDETFKSPPPHAQPKRSRKKSGV